MVDTAGLAERASIAQVRGRRRIGLGTAAVAALLTIAIPGVAVAQTPVVTPTEFDDQPESQGCTPDDCTLREAVKTVGAAAILNIKLLPGS
jgi:hypothetical protein